MLDCLDIIIFILGLNVLFKQRGTKTNRNLTRKKIRTKLDENQ